MGGDLILKMLFSALLYSTRVMIPLLATVILVCCFASLFKNLSPKRPLVVLFNKLTKEKIPVIYWENSLGRDKHSDIVINSLTASRDHAVLFRRNDGWKIADTNSSGGVFLNGKTVKSSETVNLGDVITIGGIDFELQKSDALDQNGKANKFKNLHKKSSSNSFALMLLSVFQFLLCFQIIFSSAQFTFEPLLVFAVLFVFEWLYFALATFLLKRVNLEVEILGFFLSSIGIINAYASNFSEVYTQMLALAVGLVFFNAMIFILKNPDFAMKCRVYIAALATILLVFNLVFGRVKNGSQNWVNIGSFSFQPSELVKVAFIFFGSSTLWGIQTTKNLTGFILFSAICMGALFLMGDFGSACIFFVAFILIAFMRSGSIRTVFLTCSTAFLGLLFILKFKPYIVTRFSAWRHVWEHINDIGYQQTRVLTYSASGGMFGLGIGKGNLKNIFAAPSDLVFGMICEEQGLVLALLVLILFVFMAIYAKKASARSRSAFYAISACCAAGMLLFQMMLNVFGVIDILPLTGVTLPFVSLGGSSMISAWGLLSFIKALDERTYAVKR